MDIGAILKKLFGPFGNLFRSGLDKFLLKQMDGALKLASEMLANGQFSSTDDFARALWRELRARLPHDPGTWLTILAGFVCDSLRKAGQL